MQVFSSLTCAVDVERAALVDSQLKELLNISTTALFRVEEKLFLKCVCLHHHFTSSFDPITIKR